MIKFSLVNFISIKKCFIQKIMGNKDLCINSFLAESKKKVEDISTISTLFHIILGNESCDLDSVVCSLLYAYYLYRKDCNNNTIILPILNILKHNLSIKTEVVYFLKLNQIYCDNLIFRDSPIFNLITKESPVSITLVDHHVLSNKDKLLKPYVVNIIDHRPIDSSEDWTHLKTSPILDIVGSCSTHIGDIILNNCPDIVDKNIANLIYGTILLDTACLSPKANRATPKDLNIISKLINLHPELSPKEEIFESLIQAKSDISNLTCEQLMIKDLKFTKHGIPIIGLPLLVENFLEKFSLSYEINFIKFLKENPNSYNILILMGLNIIDNNISRDIGFYLYKQQESQQEPQIQQEKNDQQLNQQRKVPQQNNDNINEDKLNEIINLLILNNNPLINMINIKNNYNNIKLYKYNNVQVSRKQILPLIEKSIE